MRTKVYHPTKTEAEMRADVRACSDKANRDYWMDPLAALYHAYDCLEARGYQRRQTALQAEVEKALGEAPARPKGPAQPCKVPCRRQ